MLQGATRRRGGWVVGALAGAAAVVGSGCSKGADLGIESVLIVATVEVVPGNVTILPSQTHAFVAIPRTSSGIPVTGRTTTWSSAQPTIATVASDGTVRGVAPGTTRITAAVDGKSGFGDVTISPIPVAEVRVTPASPTVIVGETVQLQALTLDAQGGTLTGRPTTWSSSEPLIATVGATTGLVTAVGVGRVTITATAEGKSGAATVTVQPRPAAKLGFLAAPSSATAGAAIAPAVRVAVQDVTGATVTGSTAQIVLTLGPASNGGTLAGTTTAAAVNGVATFSNLSIAKAGTGYSLTAASTGLPSATSAAFPVNPAAAAKLVIAAQPAPGGSSGSPLLPQPSIQIADAFDNPVPQAGIAVTAAIGTGSGGTLIGTATVTTNASGVAAFTDLGVSGPTGTYTIAFSAPGLTGVVSATIAIGAGSGARLTLTTAPPATAVNGQVLAPQPLVQIRDAGGNPVPQSGVIVTAAVATGSGALSGTLTATTNANGTATFTGLTITGIVGPYTLRFTAPNLTAVVSGTITLGPGPATQITFTTAPSTSAVSGQPLAVQPVIQLRDVSGNAVSQSGVTITPALAGGPAGGSLTGSPAVTGATGAATFSGLTLSGPSGAYTIGFSATGLTALTSGAIQVGAGAATKLVLSVSTPAGGQSGQPLSPGPTVQVADAAGNPVAQSGVTITATLASGSGTLSGTTSVATGAGGSAAFSNLVITGPAGSYTISFSATGLTGVTSPPITLGPGAATQLTFTVAPPATATNGQALSPQPVLQLRDGTGNAVSQAGVTVTASLASGPGSLGGTLAVVTDASGAAAFTNLALSGVTGSYTIQFSAAGVTSAVSNPITLQPGPASQLVFVTAPSSSAVSGQPLATQPVLQLTDANGNVVAQSGVTITASLASGPTGGALSGTVTAVTGSNGQVSYTNLTLTGPAGSYTIAFSGTGLTTATSNPIVIPAGNATHLLFQVSPSTSATSGQPLATQPVVRLADASGNTVATAGVSVTASVSAGATLLGTATVVTNSSGFAAFTDLAIQGLVGSSYTLTFQAGGLNPLTSPPIAITGAGPASQLTITTQPSSSATSGQPLATQPVLQVRDAAGNAVSQVVSVTASVSGATLGGTATVVTSASGVATFTDLSLTGSPGNYQLQFAATGLTGATSGSITLQAGAPSQLTFTVAPPATATSGQPLSSQPVLQLRDAGGNPVSQAGVAVMASIVPGSPAGTLGGTLVVNTDGSGVATFTDLVITGPSGNYTLAFGASGITTTTSNPIAVSGAGPTQIAFTTSPPVSATNDVAFSPQPVLQLRDANGNAVAQSGVNVTASIASGPGGTPGGTLTVATDGAGSAAFTGLKITGPVGSYTLQFASAGLTSATSGAIALGAGAATNFTFTTPAPGSATLGQPLSPAPVLQLRDVSGNTVAQSGVNVPASISSGPPSGTLGGTTAVSTDNAGAATFSNLVISGAAGTYVLAWDATGVAQTTSNPITVSAPGPTQMGFTTSPSSSAPNDVPFATQPVVQLRDAGGNPVALSGVTITASIQPGPAGTLGGTAAAVTDAAGAATFTNLEIVGLVGTYTLAFASTGLPTITANVALTPGAPAVVTITTQPSATATNDVAFAQQPVVDVKDTGGNPVPSVSVTASIASGSGTLGGGVTVTTDGAGTATYSSVEIVGLVGSYTLQFTAGSAVSPASSAITLSVGVATQLVITRQPTDVIVLFAISPAPLVELRDSGNNLVATDGVAVDVSIAMGNGSLSAALSTLTENTVGGVATFNNIRFSSAGPGSGNHRLLFSSSGLTSATSSQFKVN